jgi:hypothetical protein
LQQQHGIENIPYKDEIVSGVTVVPKCTLRGLGTPSHSTPTARYVDEKRLEDGGHLQVLCSIYAFLVTCDYMGIC